MKTLIALVAIVTISIISYIKYFNYEVNKVNALTLTIRKGDTIAHVYSTLGKPIKILAPGCAYDACVAPIDVKETLVYSVAGIPPSWTCWSVDIDKNQQVIKTDRIVFP